MGDLVVCIFFIILLLAWFDRLFGLKGQILLGSVFKEPEFELLVGFEEHIELFGKIFVPLFVAQLCFIFIFVDRTLLADVVPSFELPLVLLEKPGDQLAYKGVELGSQDALFKIVGRNLFWSGGFWLHLLGEIQILVLAEGHLPV